MSVRDVVILYASVFASILACRVIPLFVLKGRQLSPRISEAIGLIPAAAFSALVANDLFQPDAFTSDLVGGLTPFVAAVPVVLVARRTRSLIWSALVGMVAYAAILLARGML